MPLKLDLVSKVDGVERSMEVLVESVKQLDKALKRFGSYYRIKVQHRFQQEGPGWPQMAPSTLEHREHREQSSLSQARKTAEDRMRKKLTRELKRAEKSGSHVAAASRMVVLKEFERVSRGGSSSHSLVAKASEQDKETGKRRAAIQKQIRLAQKSGNHDAVKAQKERLANFDFSHKESLERLGAARAAKSLGGLGARVARAEQKTAGKVLGKIAQSVTAKVKGGVLTIASSIPWAGVHNDGGAAGKGAKIPKREFLPELDEDDWATLEGIILDQVERGLDEE